MRVRVTECGTECVIECSSFPRTHLNGAPLDDFVVDGVVDVLGASILEEPLLAVCRQLVHSLLLARVDLVLVVASDACQLNDKRRVFSGCDERATVRLDADLDGTPSAREDGAIVRTVQRRLRNGVGRGGRAVVGVKAQPKRSRCMVRAGV